MKIVRPRIRQRVGAFERPSAIERSDAPTLHAPRSPRAFTLIELLVIIAILTLLAGLLLPGLSQAKRLACSVQCKSHLRQLAFGLRLYLDDHGFYPPFLPVLSSDGSLKALDFSLPNALGAYLPAGTERFRSAAGNPTGVFKCPSLNAFSQATAEYGYSAVGLAGAIDNGQGLGGWFEPTASQLAPVTDNLRTYRAHLITEAAVKAPADRIALGDSMTSYTLLGQGTGAHFTRQGTMLGEGASLLRRSVPFWQTHFKISAAEAATSIRDRSRRHGGIANAAFCDGHVAGMTFQTLFFDESDDALRRWNNDHEPHREVLH
ncbi:MAG: prepilin-type N-terminal cleavage/methylation domain-containing protein [Verrucomicrobia bacterium]|nr:prepilin-type N-terminal cleavage/methylation domain-containing protein [Verrucomicrobiota bacterium]